MSNEALVKRLHIMSGMLQMGERIAFGSDAALMQEAATALQEALELAETWAAQAMREDDCRKMWQERAETAEAEVQKLRKALDALKTERRDLWDLLLKLRPILAEGRYPDDPSFQEGVDDIDNMLNDGRARAALTGDRQ